jgi:hypothetical protein
MVTAASELGDKTPRRTCPLPVLSATRGFAFRTADHIVPCSLTIWAKDRNLAATTKFYLLI